MKRSPAYLSREDWKAKFALLESQYPSKAVDYQPMFPMGELEYALSHPVPYQTISVRPPSDPGFAFRAIFVAMATCQNVNTRP